MFLVLVGMTGYSGSALANHDTTYPVCLYGERPLVLDNFINKVYYMGPNDMDEARDAVWGVEDRQWELSRYTAQDLNRFLMEADYRLVQYIDAQYDPCPSGWARRNDKAGRYAWENVRRVVRRAFRQRVNREFTPTYCSMYQLREAKDAAARRYNFLKRIDPEITNPYRQSYGEASRDTVWVLDQVRKYIGNGY